MQITLLSWLMALTLLGANPLDVVKVATGEVGVAVAMCESGGVQEMNGKVVKNPNSSAIGIFQILEKTHGGAAKNLGYDIRTLEGNISYAQYLMGKNGLRDWTVATGTRECLRRGGYYPLDY